MKEHEDGDEMWC